MHAAMLSGPACALNSYMKRVRTRESQNAAGSLCNPRKASCVSYGYYDVMNRMISQVFREFANDLGP
jgi:hypothetical protein